MVNVEITGLDHIRKGGRRKRRYERVKTAEGTIETVYRIDISSDDFGAQFAMVFQSAVNKARRENKRLLGTSDVEPD